MKPSTAYGRLLKQGFVSLINADGSLRHSAHYCCCADVLTTGSISIVLPCSVIGSFLKHVFIYMNISEMPTFTNGCMF